MIMEARIPETGDTFDVGPGAIWERVEEYARMRAARFYLPEAHTRGTLIRITRSETDAAYAIPGRYKVETMEGQIYTVILKHKGGEDEQG